MKKVLRFSVLVLVAGLIPSLAVSAENTHGNDDVVVTTILETVR